MSQPSSNSRNIISLARSMAMSLPTVPAASEAPASVKPESMFAATSTPAAASSSAPAQETKKRKSPEHSEAAHAENATKKTKKNDSSVLSPIQKLKEELSAVIKAHQHHNAGPSSNTDAIISTITGKFLLDYCQKNSFKSRDSFGALWGNCALSNLAQVLKKEAGENIFFGLVAFTCEPSLKQEGKEQEEKEKIQREVAFYADGQSVIFVDGRNYNPQTKQGEPVVESLETEFQYMKDGVLFSVYPPSQTVRFMVTKSFQKPQQTATVTAAAPMEIAAAAASSSQMYAPALSSPQPVAAPQLFAPAAAATSRADRMEIDNELPALEDAQFVHILEHGSAEELFGERLKYINSHPKIAAKFNKLLEAAASKGHIIAQFHLGSHYEHGSNGHFMHIPKARNWYEKAAAQGHVDSLRALRRLAVTHPQHVQSSAQPSTANGSNHFCASSQEFAQPVPVAAAAATSLVHANAPQPAAAAAASSANSNVAQPAASSSAPLPPTDVNFERILKHGSSEQQYEEFLKYVKEKEYVKARVLLQTTADKGYAFAQNTLASAYINGKWGIEKDEQQALEWTKKAAAQNYSFGQGRLGCAYENGHAGLPKNIPEALTWYKKAAAQGNRLAQAAIACLTPQSHDEVMQVQASQAEQNRIAKNLKNLGASNLMIINATGLTIAEIEKL